MKMYLICMIIILLYNNPVKAQSGIPVFIIDYDNVLNDLKVDSNPFDKMTPTKFVDLLYLTIKKSERVIIFVENMLSSEDISAKDDRGTPYLHLSQHLEKKRLKYIPSVQQPYKILKRIFQPQQNNVLYLRFVKKPDIRNNYKYYYVHFEDVYNETRTEKMRRHDEIMQDLYDYVSKIGGGPVLAIYTALKNPTASVGIRGRIIDDDARKDLGTTLSSDGGLIHLRGVFTSKTHRKIFLQPPTVRNENYDHNAVSTRIAFNHFDLRFNFSLHPDQWVLDSIGLLQCGKEVGSVHVGVGTVYRNSFVCGVPLQIKNREDGSIITISHYQVQPYHPDIIKRLVKRSRSGIEGNSSAVDEESNKTSASSGKHGVSKPIGKFGDAEHCTPFFTAPILSGLMISFLCFGIMMWGILMLIDVKTVDKFDNPHNKPLVINVYD